MPELQLYQPRRPRASPLWKCVHDHFDAFRRDYDRKHIARHGPLRPVVVDVIEKYLDCGDLHRGFARVRCPTCQLEYLLAFSCKTRGFCPSCQQKRTVAGAQFLVEAVFAAVPHRHYVFSLPIALRGFFQRDRTLLKDLCRLANESLVEWMRTILDRADGAPGVVMALHTFGDHLNFQPHLHALVSDGLFDHAGVFHTVPETSLRGLRELFQANVYRLLVQRKALSPALVHNFLKWKHSGFNLFRGDPVPPENRAELENLAQYILRHSFSLDKITYEPRAARVIYHSRMNLTTHRNFEVFAATDFLAAVTQHIPDKGFQLVKYYGRYSNKARGQRRKLSSTSTSTSTTPESPPPEGWPDASGVGTGRVEAVPPASSGQSQIETRKSKIPSRTWRELIKKVWNADPLACPKCGGEMKLIALIEERPVIEEILRHLNLWEGPVPGPAPPPALRLELQYEPFDDDVPFGPGDTFAS